VKGTGNPRQAIDRSEALAALDKFADWIAKGNWPPA
jgi:hypothetical protein